MFQNSYVEIMTNINSNEISQLQYEVKLIMTSVLLFG